MLDVVFEVRSSGDQDLESQRESRGISRLILRKNRQCQLKGSTGPKVQRPARMLTVGLCVGGICEVDHVLLLALPVVIVRYLGRPKIVKNLVRALGRPRVLLTKLGAPKISF